jgi:hypothetical protein
VRLTSEREAVIRDWVERHERGSNVSWRGFVVELLDEIDRLREFSFKARRLPTLEEIKQFTNNYEDVEEE